LRDALSAALLSFDELRTIADARYVVPYTLCRVTSVAINPLRHHWSLLTTLDLYHLDSLAIDPLHCHLISMATDPLRLRLDIVAIYPCHTISPAWQQICCTTILWSDDLSLWRSGLSTHLPHWDYPSCRVIDASSCI